MSEMRTLANDGDKKQVVLDLEEALVDKGTAFLRPGLFEEVPTGLEPGFSFHIFNIDVTIAFRKIENNDRILKQSVTA